jgi:hypothetical protein
MSQREAEIMLHGGWICDKARLQIAVTANEVDHPSNDVEFFDDEGSRRDDFKVKKGSVYVLAHPTPRAPATSPTDEVQVVTWYGDQSKAIAAKRDWMHAKMHMAMRNAWGVPFCRRTVTRAHNERGQCMGMGMVGDEWIYELHGVWHALEWAKKVEYEHAGIPEDVEAVDISVHHENDPVVQLNEVNATGEAELKSMIPERLDIKEWRYRLEVQDNRKSPCRGLWYERDGSTRSRSA